MLVDSCLTPRGLKYAYQARDLQHLPQQQHILLVRIDRAGSA
jgi:hypothetical protein